MKRDVRFRRIVGECVRSFLEHDDATQSAALAFYTLFSLGPVLFVVIFIAGLFLGRGNVQGRIVGEFGNLMGPQAAISIQSLLAKTVQWKIGGVAGLVGAVVILFGATVVLVQLQSSLNLVWGVAPQRGRFFATLLRKRLLSLALLLGIGFLLLVSLAVNAGLSGLGEFLGPHIPVGWLLSVNFALSFVVTAILFAMIFRILPDAEIEWRDVALGALVTSLLFGLGKWLIGAYLGRTSFASDFGAAGSVVIVLLWVYYSSILLLGGAELTKAYATDARAGRANPEKGARRIASTRRPGLFAPPVPRRR